MKKTYLLITLLSVLIAMSGCGNNINGFKESNSTTAPTDESTEKIQIEAKCTTLPLLIEYVELQSGDTIIRDEDPSSITLYHDENNKKLVCLNSGKAHIERAITQ